MIRALRRWLWPGPLAWDELVAANRTLRSPRGRL